MSNVYSMIATLLGVSLFRILEIGVNQSASSMASSAYRVAADPEPNRCDNPRRSRIHRGQVSEMGRRHNDHRRNNLPSPAVPIAPHLESKQE